MFYMVKVLFILTVQAIARTVLEGRSIQAQILSLLDELKERLNMALLLITHDLGVVRKMSDRVCVMSDGNLVEKGLTEEIFTNPQHEYTQHLLAAEPSGDPIAADSDAPVVMSADKVSVVFNLAKGMFAKQKILKAVDQVSVVVREGQTLGVVGESGSGKTTLLKALLNLIAVSYTHLTLPTKRIV